MNRLVTLLFGLVSIVSVEAAPGFSLRDVAFVGSLALAALPGCDAVNDASLKGYWKLDEASGNAMDDKGANDLTDNNTVTSGTGKIGTAREFSSASAEYFSLADNADLSTGDISWTVIGWFIYTPTLVGGQYPHIVSKFAAGQQEYLLFLNGDSQRVELQVSNDGTATATVQANNHGDPADNAWHHVIAWHDAPANTINIQVDGGTVDSAAHTTGTFDGTGPFQVGAANGAFSWTGLIDEVFFTKRVLTAGERTALYNGGAGCRPAGL